MFIGQLVKVVDDTGTKLCDGQIYEILNFKDDQVFIDTYPKHKWYGCYRFKDVNEPKKLEVVTESESFEDRFIRVMKEHVESCLDCAGVSDLTDSTSPLAYTLIDILDGMGYRAETVITTKIVKVS